MEPSWPGLSVVRGSGSLLLLRILELDEMFLENVVGDLTEAFSFDLHGVASTDAQRLCFRGITSSY